ncbi:TPA: UPF0175 family protein [Candidatus Poribacteria bacterium]|nr:UPF0175 family protein [Candidatus Poribacteria bacterium]
MKLKEINNSIKGLVESGIYKSEEEALSDALENLLKNNPEYRMKLALYRYQHENISIGKAAEIAGVPWEAMRDALNENGIPLRLAPLTIEELQKDCETIWRFTCERNRK